MDDMLKVLIVEDDETKIQEWNDAITAHNADAAAKGFVIEYISAKSARDAKRQIELHWFDAVIVDLRLETEPGVSEANNDGNELVRQILAAQPVGLVVFTGQRSEADEASYGTPQVKVMDKGDGLDQVFKWLTDNRDVFQRLRAAKAAFNREAAKIFFQSIWPRWKHWTVGGPDDAALTEILARHMVAHVHDSLLSAGGDTTHPEEAYFVPPLKSRLDTGDMLDYDDRTWIVVTPRCDLAREPQIKTVVLAACEDVSDQWNKLVADKKGGAIQKFTQHNRSPKQHFLAPMQLGNTKRGPWMVQFHDIRSIPTQEALTDLVGLRFASLSSLFIPSLVERFGAYFSRIGTPDLSTE